MLLKATNSIELQNNDNDNNNNNNNKSNNDNKSACVLVEADKYSRI